jgi:uncharacterized protein YndB with AHSA1/START domain
MAACIDVRWASRRCATYSFGSTTAAVSGSEPLPMAGCFGSRGVFEQLAPPHLLVYTWQPEQQPPFAERVTVQFEPVGDACDVSIVHERIANADSLRGHESGWQGCLDRLVKHLS